MFKKAVHIDLMYTELPYWERFAAAKRDGFDAVEFYKEGWEEKDLGRIKEESEKNDIAISAATGANPNSMCCPDEKDAYIEFAIKLINAAKEIGCPQLMCHSDCLDPTTNYAAKKLSKDYSLIEKSANMVEILKTLAPIAREAGVLITLEMLSDFAHPGYFLHDTKTAVELIKAVNEPNVKILYDAYHMYIEEGKISDQVSKYIDYIGHFHVADSPGRHDPGTGDMNYKNILKNLAEAGYEGYVAFEFYPIDGTPKAVEAIKNILP
ncbi:MAG: TIM barrel protein [Eubacterium sp.]|nr:TIM barrel protein [Eubacterium sp.]